MCGYSLTTALGKYISHAHLSLIKDESMNATQLLILPHVQSLLLTILQTRRQQSVGFILSKTVLPRRYTTDCLGCEHVKRTMSICPNTIWKSTILGWKYTQFLSLSVYLNVRLPVTESYTDDTAHRLLLSIPDF